MATLIAFGALLLACESGEAKKDEPTEKTAESESAREGVDETVESPVDEQGAEGEQIGDEEAGDKIDGTDPSQGDALTPEPDAEWVACEKDEDCIVLELQCCDHCNGGRAIAVNEQFKAEAIARLKEKNCEGVICTMLACPDLLPHCTEGTCETKDAEFP